MAANKLTEIMLAKARGRFSPEMEANIVLESDGSNLAPDKCGEPFSVYVTINGNPEPKIALYPVDFRLWIQANAPVLVRKKRDGKLWITRRNERRYQQSVASQGALDTIQGNQSFSPHVHSGGAQGPKIDINDATVSTLSDARLSSNVMLLTGAQTASGAKTFASATITELGVTASTQLTLATGTVARTQTFHRIETEGGAGSDDLDTITGGVAGDMAIIRAADAAHTVVVTTAGNILTPDGTNITLDETYKMLVLVYDGTLSKWIVMWGATSGGTVDAADVTYTPAVPGDYDGTPAFVAPALDELASRVELLEGGGGGAISGVLSDVCQGRLTLESGVAVSTSDQQAKSTLYFTPYRGNVIWLYDGTSGAGYPFSQLSLSLSGYDRHRLYDIFCYLNAGTPALEALGWTAPTSGSISGVTNANPPVVTSAAHPLAVGDIVTVYGVVGATGVNGTFRVSAIATNTFTLQTLAAANPGAPGAYSSGGAWVKKYSGNTRATALALQNGVLVKSGDATRRYLGTICINANGGETDDTTAFRLVYNYYNRVAASLINPIETTDSWSYTVSTWRAGNNNFANRAEFVLGATEQMLHVEVTVYASTGVSSSAGSVGVGLDSTSANSAQILESISTNAERNITTRYQGMPASAGLHFVHWLEIRRVGTVNFYGDFGDPVYFQSGLIGMLMP